MDEPTPAQRLRALYERIPTINCKRKCQAFCVAVFDDGATSNLERERVYSLHGVRSPIGGHGCGYLDDAGRCGIYAMRPLVCRIWAALDVPGMRCPHGCEPEHYLTPGEAQALFTEAHEIGGGRAMPTEFAISERERQEGMLMMIMGAAAENDELWKKIVDGSRDRSAVNAWRTAALRRGAQS